MTHPQLADHIVIAATPDQLYDLVSDVTRTGEWSPICRACWWDDGDGPRVGAWFTGRNQTPERTWETRSQVVVADPGREFAWEVGGGLARWGYRLRPVEAGTDLTEYWEFLPAGLARFAERYGADADAEIDQRTAAAREGIPRTLAALKQIAERDAAPTAER